MGMEIFSLHGKIALVTGGATGIGQAIAVGLAGAGADIAVTVNNTPATTTAEQVRALGRRCLEVSCNLADPANIKPLVEEVEQQLGPIDILVNNAGIIRREWAENYSDSDWQAVMELNLDALWYLSQAVGRGMVQRGQGKIISIASLLSFQGGIRVPAYTAAKHAVAGLTKALANEWAIKGLNVNAIAPGYIATDNTTALRTDPERSRQILERIPAGRWGQTSDLVGAAVFLASAASDYVNGHLLLVDGGWMAR
jgi:2-deoxy-D-gluconate 3-dehydrogenase